MAPSRRSVKESKEPHAPRSDPAAVLRERLGNDDGPCIDFLWRRRDGSIKQAAALLRPNAHKGTISQTVDYEVLLSRLSRHVDSFRIPLPAGRRAASKRRSVRGMLAAKVRELIARRRKAAGLAAEVNGLLKGNTSSESQADKLQSSVGFVTLFKAPAVAETPVQRQSRRSSFWRQYHAMPLRDEAVLDEDSEPCSYLAAETNVERIRDKHRERMSKWMPVLPEGIRRITLTSRFEDDVTSEDSPSQVQSARERHSLARGSRAASTRQSSQRSSARESRVASLQPLKPAAPAPSSSDSPERQWRTRGARDILPRPRRSLLPKLTLENQSLDTGVSESRGAQPPEHGWKGSPRMVSFGAQECSKTEIPLPARTFGDARFIAKKPSNSLCTKKYMQACEKYGTLPILLPFMTGHSPRLAGAGLGLVDQDLLAIAAVMPCIPKVEEIDLQNNELLTEQSLVPLIQKLFGSNLRKLSLRRCMRAGHIALTAVAQLISALQGARYLEHLDLSRVTMGMSQQVALCEAIQSHPTLQTVQLADIGLGAHPTGRQCVGNLLSSKSLRTLDLGWNPFNAEMFEHLGECVLEKKALRSLAVANCASLFHGRSGTGNPTELLVEALSRDRGLTRLDLSLNRLDHRGALVLEDALGSHPSLTELDVSHNPFGVSGLRSVVRMLSDRKSLLTRFSCDDCGQLSTWNHLEDVQEFSITAPGARYVLDLAQTYHRAVLRMLYRTCERLGLPAGEALSELEASPQPYAHPQKDGLGHWPVPRAGTLSLTFAVPKSICGNLASVDAWDFGSVLRSYYFSLKLKPDFNRLVPLLVQFQQYAVRTRDQLAFLDALSCDILIEYEHVEELCRAREMIGEVLLRMLPGLAGRPCARFLTTLLVPTIESFSKLVKDLRNYLHFNLDNPTGHYSLYLGNPADRAIADQLILLDWWEMGISERQGRLDISQRGNRSQVRNERFGERPLKARSVVEWSLPHSEVLQLDYVTTRRPPIMAPVLAEPIFKDVLRTLLEAQHNLTDQTSALRMISHKVYLKSFQMRELLGVFQDSALRAEVFVMFFFRLTDIYNEKAFRVRFKDPEEFVRLRERLGHAALLPCVQPEQAKFRLDFSNYEERLVASVLVGLANAERFENLRDMSLANSEGMADPASPGTVKLWERMDQVPSSGIFQACYVCAPEDRNFDKRIQFLHSHGFWETDTDSDHVLWWSALSEAPVDVLELLEFCVAHFPDVYEPFHVMDEPDHNGVLSLEEFEEGIKKLKCRKFKGQGQAQRIRAIFQYLDPSGGGTVSKSEWGVLQQLWREIQVSIAEFVRFLDRTFGGDLSKAWHALDNDSSGSLSEPEWCRGCQRIGFFGHIIPIFRFLDKDDCGSITPDEFEALHTYFKKDMEDLVWA